ncbi:MAG: DUF5677 domain-containing protein [Methylococcales bacterium]|nr:DUF5677 domain-containing protein [Methylococcales bacterium]MDP3838684.1 DUF5677 domain-containing protein [Methylococcales bacterium]
MEAYKNEIKEAQNYMEYLKFDKSHPWHRNLIALYLSLIEYSDSLICLVENEKSIAIPLIFRGLLEAYVDFKNLAENETYIYYMEANNVKQELTLLKEASNNNNVYLALIASEPSLLTATIQQYEATLTELSKKGYKPLKIFEKFEKAGMIDEFKSIYNDLCSHSHNNINSFTGKFVDIDEAQNDFEITHFKEQADGEIERHLITGCSYLRNASHKIHAVLETGYENKFPV